MNCVLCHKMIGNSTDRYLIDGKQQNVRNYILRLPFAVNICSSYVCKSCLRKLEKREKLKKQEEDLLQDIEKLANSCLSGRESVTTESLGAKKQRVSFPTCSLSPVKIPWDTVQSVLQSPPSPALPDSQINFSAVSTSTPRKTPSNEPRSSTTSVTVKVQWPSETRERSLPKDLESLGKMLVRGTYKQVARAAWQNPALHKELQTLALKQIDKECSGLC